MTKAVTVLAITAAIGYYGFVYHPCVRHIMVMVNENRVPVKLYQIRRITMNKFDFSSGRVVNCPDDWTAPVEVDRSADKAAYAAYISVLPDVIGGAVLNRKRGELEDQYGNYIAVIPAEAVVNGWSISILKEYILSSIDDNGEFD
jgi:hypothetical protein